MATNFKSPIEEFADRLFNEMKRSEASAVAIQSPAEVSYGASTPLHRKGRLRFWRCALANGLLSTVHPMRPHYLSRIGTSKSTGELEV